MVELDFEKGEGLIPVVTQDYETNDVLMLAYMNRAAWLKTLETGRATYWSRSRKTLWVKGETSGNVQIVREIFVDCDLDTVVLKVDQVGGAACHMGYRSCFYRRVSDGKMEIIGERIFDPEEVYKK
ncbi:MAG: phosphoribosyl-AMP cyclohydrolase [Thermodesulfobacteriota bacterium]|nr:phosphoribosyl-AMP cyclohydrolase [Thermodesulfobacteriota bacterium]